MKTSELKNTLIGVDHLSSRNGIFTARRSYFYGTFESGEKFAESIKEQLPSATILEFGNHYAHFKGGAPINKQSHYWVKFTVNEVG